MTDKETFEAIYKDTPSRMRRANNLNNQTIKELRRQLKWCYRAIWFMQGSVIVLAIGVLLSALFQLYPY
jgi:hypothetical protein